jgi:hypothetical protein
MIRNERLTSSLFEAVPEYVYPGSAAVIHDFTDRCPSFSETSCARRPAAEATLAIVAHLLKQGIPAHDFTQETAAGAVSPEPPRCARRRRRRL